LLKFGVEPTDLSCQFDFSMVFDSVYHELYILNLRQRFHITAVALSFSYLSPRHQMVACGDDFSSLTPLVASFLQASIKFQGYFSTLFLFVY
jgi:hypothetical protein